MVDEKNKKALKKKEPITFLWQGLDRKGNKHKGETHADTLAQARMQVQRKGYRNVKVKKRPKEIKLSAPRVTAKDVTIFSRQMATMISAGVPIAQCLEMLGTGNDNPAMTKMLKAVKEEVESGSTFAESLAKHPRHFDRLYCSLINAGEEAGILDNLMDKIAIYQEKIESIKQKVKKALFYPVAVMIVAFIVMAVLLIFVIPTFEGMFKNFGADLPAFTRLVLDFSAWFQKYWWAVLASIGITFFAFREAKLRSEGFVHLIDRIILQIPVFGGILRKATIARYCRTLATMFAAGVPLVDALNTVASAAGNVVYTKGIMSIRANVSTGMPLNAAMRDSGLFPHMVVQMTAVGEEVGSLDEMLGKVADFYEEEVDTAVESMSSLMEPFILVFLGGMIGSMVIAMYLPIFKFASVV